MPVMTFTIHYLKIALRPPFRKRGFELGDARLFRFHLVYCGGRIFKTIRFRANNQEVRILHHV